MIYIQTGVVRNYGHCFCVVVMTKMITQDSRAYLHNQQSWLKSLLFPFTAYNIFSYFLLWKVYWFWGSYFSSLFGTWCWKCFSNVIQMFSKPLIFKELFILVDSFVWKCLLKGRKYQNCKSRWIMQVDPTP